MDSNRRVFFISFLISYMALVAITIVGGVVAYWSAYRVVLDQSVKFNQNVVVQVKETIDSGYTDLLAITRQIEQSRQVLDFRRVIDPYHGSDVIRLMELQWSLPDFQNSHRLIHSYFLTFPLSSTVVLPRASFRQNYFHEVVFADTQTDFLSWLTLVSTRHFYSVTPIDGIRIADQSLNALLLTHSLWRDRSPVVNVVFVLDTSVIASVLENIPLGTNGAIRIRSSHGTLLMSLGDTNLELDQEGRRTILSENSRLERTSTGNFIITEIASPTSGWHYEVIQNEAVVFQSLRILEQRLITILVVAVFIGIMGSLYLATARSAPLATIALIANKRVTGLLRPGKEMDVVRDSFVELESQLEAQKPVIRASLFERLFRGEYSSETHLMSELTSVGVRPTKPPYAVGVLWLDHIPTNANTQSSTDHINEGQRSLILKRVLNSIGIESTLIHDLGSGRVAFIAESNSDITSTNCIIETITSASTKLDIQSPVIGLGSWNENLLNVGQSYAEALTALEYAIANELPFASTESVPTLIQTDSVPSGIEARLASTIRSGDLEQTKKIMAEIKNSTVAGRGLIRLSSKMLLFSLSGLVTRLQNETGTEVWSDSSLQLVDERISRGKLGEAYHQIETSILEIATQKREIMDSRGNPVARRAKEYVDLHMTEPGLCLTVLAESLSVSEFYVSRVFKAIAGVSFHIYVEKNRIELAKEQLQDPSITVKDVAQAVGFTSLSTFTRTFKRHVGVSPKEFRSSI